MIDWLRSDPRTPPTVLLGDRSLPVIVRRLERARRMTLRLGHDGLAVHITIPRWTRTAEALAFVYSRTDWLARQLHALPEQVAPLADGSSLAYRGETVTIRHSASAPRRPALADGVLSLGGPVTALSGRVARWLQDRAREHLARDLSHYCGLAQVPTPPLALSSARRRWGSCSTSGTIRINWRLIMAPDFVRRSVVAHEVAHLLHFDHSPAFHACLDRLFEDSVEAANRWLATHGRGLYHPFG